MGILDEALAEREGILVLDGGLATELEAAGADLSGELWSARLLVDDPGSIRDAHARYLRAGADVVITSSYQASFEGFASLGVDAAGAARLMRRSVELARQATQEWCDGSQVDRPRPLVAASVGPYGAVLANGAEYTGDYDRSVGQLVDFHVRRIDALMEAAPDVLAIETIPSIAETVALAETLTRVSGVEAWISFTCRDGATLADGTPFADALEVVVDATAIAAVGVNCTAPSSVADLVAIAASKTSRPLVAYPNRGGVWDADTKRWRGGGEPALVRLAPSWIDAGVSLIGGCCGTVADDIAAMVRALGRASVSDRATPTRRRAP